MSIKRQAETTTTIYMKPINVDNNKDSFHIGNCNSHMNINLKGVHVRFIPEPTEDDSQLFIQRGLNSSEFADSMDLDGIPSYYEGYCNMNINIRNTVLKFYIHEHEREDGTTSKSGILIINTKKRKNNKDKINNPCELRIFMRRVNVDHT